MPSITPALAALQTESRNSRSTHIDQVSTLDLCRIINDEDAGVAQAVAKCLPSIAAAIDATAPRIRAGGRLIYVGAGTSGRLGVLDASEIQPTFSAPPWQFVGIIAGGDAAIRQAQEGAEDNREAAVRDLEALQLDPSKDTLLGIASSGRTPYVLSCLDYAHHLGCLTLGLACSYPSEMSQSIAITHMISVVTGGEVVTGSTRLKAGTGTKMILNMLSTGIMIKIGKTYGNLMVDLKASNFKLKQRSRNIIRNVHAGSKIKSDEELDAAIATCGGSVKLTLMMLMTGSSKEDAERRLARSGDNLLAAIQAWQTESQAVSDIAVLNSPELVVCIDAGGSKCAVVVSDNEGNHFKGTAGPCNFTDVGLDKTREAITLATQEALEQYWKTFSLLPFEFPVRCNEQRSPFNAVLAGIAGFDRPGAREALLPMIAKVFGTKNGPSMEVMGDTDFLHLVINKHPSCHAGLVLIAGTGSVAMAYRMDEESGKFVRTGRTGGWGHLLGDEGSGFDIGKQGIRATLAALEANRLCSRENGETRSLSGLHLAMLEMFGISSDTPSADLLSRVLQPDSGRGLDLKGGIAAAATVVLSLASSDTEAEHIVKAAAVNLCRLIQPLLCPHHVDPSNSTLVLAGSLMKNQTLRDGLLNELTKTGQVFEFVECVDDPATAVVKTMITVQRIVGEEIQ